MNNQQQPEPETAKLIKVDTGLHQHPIYVAKSERHSCANCDSFETAVGHAGTYCEHWNILVSEKWACYLHDASLPDGTEEMPGIAIRRDMAEPDEVLYEAQYIAQSPADYATSQDRITELERENKHLLRLLNMWQAAFGKTMHSMDPLLQSTLDKLARQ